MHGNSDLCQFIAQQIQTHPEHRVTFATFMDWALYHPEYGYYSQKARTMGNRGDFFTSVHLGADFGELLAEQLAEMWQILNQPSRFAIVEMGAGQGWLAQDILTYLSQHHPDVGAGAEYIIVEKTPGLIAEQQRQLQPWQHRKTAAGHPQLRWSSPADLAPLCQASCFISNELVDAFPVHQVVWTEGILQEVYVTLENGELQEILAPPSTPALSQYFEWLGLDLSQPAYPDPYRTEVNLAALSWMQDVAQVLTQGYVLTIDYGYPAFRYYSPVRSQGTLQCYYQHQRHNNPYLNLGNQDITAHVNFTALEQHGAAVGLSVVGSTQQTLFLTALGLVDRIAQLGQSDSTDPREIVQRLHRRQALHQLIDPMGLGEFTVLLQSKGLTPEQQRRSLQGLATPTSLTGDARAKT
jgi:SAM-dependent MidA family methyltransferase